MIPPSILRTITQRRLLPATKKPLLNVRPSSRNIRLDGRPYRATQRKSHEAAKKGAQWTFWRSIGNNIPRGMEHRMFYSSAFILGVAIALLTPKTEESKRRQGIWSGLMKAPRGTGEADEETKAEVDEETGEAEDAEDAEDATRTSGGRTSKTNSEA